MDIKISTEKGKTTLYLSSNIDVMGADSLKKSFSEIVKNDSIKEVCLDFKEVGFLGSPGIGKLLMFYKNSTSKEGKIKVVSLKNEIAALFKSIQLDKLFSCSDLE